MKPPLVSDLALDAARWRRWLGWRYPHYDRMAEDAARTLTATRPRSCAGFDASTESVSEWHVSLFTRTRQTSDPAATFAAALCWKPIGMILHHVVTPGPAMHERAPFDPRPEQIARAVAHARSALAAARAARTDERAPAAFVDRAEQRAATLTSEARSFVEQAITGGLLARGGFLLVPPMIVKPDMLDDCRLYLFALAVRAELDSRPPAEALVLAATWRRCLPLVHDRVPTPPTVGR